MNILYLSNLIYSKGIVYLIEAFTSLEGEHTLNVYGEVMGDEYKTKAQMISIINGYSHVKGLKYHGIASRDQVSRIYESNDVFVLPTFYSSEAAPVSVLEAMKHNCCVILTDHKFLKKVYGEFNVTWINKESTQDLINALNSVECTNSVRDHNKLIISSRYGLERFELDLRSILFNLDY